MAPPKLFVSYSWSSPDHERWVLDLATQLVDSGIDVILDKWELKEGHDSVAFMEKMVTDPSIEKVLMISDRLYAEKADGRAGGVGTETQIISREVYENQSQGKFVAVLPCRNEHGKPYLPTYYKSRIYIDLSEQDRYTENFEQLLRWVFGKPLHVKPVIGNLPAFLTEGEHVSLGTTAIFNRCMDAIKSNKPFMAGAVDDYFNAFAENLERFRIAKTEDTEFDDAVVESIDEFTPHRGEFVQLLSALAQYAPTSEMAQKTHRFFEKLIPYLYKPASVSQYSGGDFDNFRFIIHELFLHALATLIKRERFDFANELLTQQYYWPGTDGDRESAMQDFNVFCQSVDSLNQHRNRRLGLRKLSVQAELLKKRAETSGVLFKDLMQADFILFMRKDRNNTTYSRWWPITLIYASHSYSPFEVFGRAVSTSYFNRAKCLLAINEPADLSSQLDGYSEDRKSLPRWEFNTFDPLVLLGFEKLASKP